MAIPVIPYLMLAAALIWAACFRSQWRHRKDRRPTINTALVEIEMILGFGLALGVELLLLLVAVLW